MTQSIRFMCTWCVRYENIYHTHKQSHIHCRTSIIMVYQLSITSVILVTYTVSQSCCTYVSGSFESSFRQVMQVCVVRSHMHLSLVHTLSHFAKVMTTKFPSHSWTITLPSARATVTKNNAKEPRKSFQATMPTSKPISLHAGQLESLSRQPHTD